ncbi:MAG: hypothetical protein MUD14_06735 [Hydrococcus sp. Prado102]|nr:hypothetical protein [Hydrococcus sp. Prado102]
MPTRKLSPNNGRGTRDARTQWLDKALEGKPSEIKARVLEIILKMGIDPENEFFVILGSERGSDQQVSQQPASRTESEQDSVEQRQPSPDVRRVVPKDQKRGFHLGR